MIWPKVRGTLTQDRSLADLTWLRVGGPAMALFQPADLQDLQDFLHQLPREIDVFPMGVGSNLIIRDGGLDAVVIRLGRGFNSIEISEDRVICGAAALDAHVARKAADAGLDLSFLRTIPGAIGGAVRMNAGCYGTYIADVFIEARAVSRAGELIVLGSEDLRFGYRESTLPAGYVIVEATLQAQPGASEEIHAKMADQLARRDATQPTKERTAGSTFRNPAGFSSTGRADDTHELKAWSLIEAAGMRGARLGGAQMSEKHPNFLINTGGATAADLENLGERVRQKVRETSDIDLQWEVLRIGHEA
ncbi:MAG: UDP-N-acetylmuramate dehydrogenase [Pseudomonadota bacterium]